MKKNRPYKGRDKVRRPPTGKRNGKSTKNKTRQTNIFADAILPHGVNRNPPAEDEVTPGVLADMLGISDQTVRHWIREKGMPVYRMTVGIRPRYYISLKDAARWLRSEGIIE